MQRGWWTPSGTGEVTVNIFSLKATQMMLGTSPKNAPWLIGQKSTASKYLLNPKFSTWKNNPGIALFVYAQVIEDFGWNSMKNVMSSYETGVSSTYPTTDQGIIDFFWSKYSLEVGVDLSGLLKKWAIPFTSDFTSKVVGLPPYVERINLFGPWIITDLKLLLFYINGINLNKLICFNNLNFMILIDNNEEKDFFGTIFKKNPIHLDLYSKLIIIALNQIIKFIRLIKLII